MPYAVWMNDDNHAAVVLSLLNSLSITNVGLERLLTEILATGGFPNVRDVNLLQTIRNGTNTPSAIARATALPNPSVSQALTRLTESGFIERNSNNVDKRKRNITLTPEGETTLTNALTHIDTTFNIARYPQNTDALTKLQRSLDKYSNSMRLNG
jgi:DNA-binding MarR family transcriptional regulator